ncbi:Lrp/AsnC family transcriptional regulator [Dietzia sp. PP-33]|jgi:DNA-binding Lrp family transcriptional regulator|uniref:Lrp/AsnC family transcriptional regulator n=1 Tax=Dietzia sp. PP-33 TaxID=2957500 RepID=UPI0029A207AC|nr:Lrp/AsnC ligand binding domain-containing protein [Dietzia sp. PP-33]MDX2358030.1 Lrp/AsnC ligand binding domain-containing protein [Dietzia sp. PP-33]
MDAAPHIDDTDRRLLKIVLAAPRVGVREFSRRLGVARGTAQARLDKLEARGVLGSWAPTLDPAALGYPLSALVHIQMAQAELEETCAGLAEVREILEVMSVAGEFDIVCRVVARDHAHLEEVFSAIISTRGVLRTRTEVILRQRVGPRLAQLLDG